MLASLESPIIPVMAFGETLEQFEQNKTLEVINEQLLEGLKGLKADDFKDIILAYEPIWAIGTGKTATSLQAQEVIKQAREIIKKQFGQEAANVVRIQYGGSVKPENVE